MKPPTFFLSSTIYDFMDLRSAVKYYLESQGCRVLASEFNDFAKPLDVHSYQACLKSIAEADFFVLFIGARVGGWFDEAGQVSITQREYREAYGLHQAGRLKLLNFVRADVWRMKDDRKLLAKHLETIDLDPGAKCQVLLSPTKSATNAAFIVGFIEEVGKNRETIEAAKGSSQLPTGNWLHQFTTFRDVIEPIQVQAFCGRPVEEAALRRLLRQELFEMLRTWLVKMEKGIVMAPERTLGQLHSQLPDGLDVMANPTTIDIWLPKELYFQVAHFWMLAGNKRFTPLILKHAVSSTVFMDYDPVSGAIVELAVHKALGTLWNELTLYGLVDRAEMGRAFHQHLLLMTPEKGQHIPVHKIHLALMLHLLDRWVNIGKLCRAIIRHLDGGPFEMPTLQPRSNLYSEKKMDDFNATTSDTDLYLGLSDG